MMLRAFKKLPLIIAVIFILFAILPETDFAEPKKAAEDDFLETGYHLQIDDAADLLTQEEEMRLQVTMEDILPYGNAAFASTDSNSGSEEDYARNKYREFFGRDSGTLFLIDMSNRKIFIFSDGSIYRSITRTRANEITDNVYTYATAGDYCECADRAFAQIATILDGGRITTPMKYATNAAFAAGIVLFINFLIIYSQRKRSKKSKEIASATEKAYAAGTAPGIVKDLDSVMTKQTKHRHVESSGGSGGGGGGGFSGGGGGGGSSGGGGGHSF